MEIRAKCNFDLEAIKALTHLSVFGKSNPKSKFRVWFIISLVSMAFIIFEMVFFSDIGILWMLCLTLFILLLECYLYFLLPKIRYKNLAKIKGAENEFVFCDDTLKVFTRCDEYRGEAEMEYSLFPRVYETSKYFFLFQTNNQVYIVDKSTIEGGTAEEIRSKLTANTKCKYIICSY